MRPTPPVDPSNGRPFRPNHLTDEQIAEIECAIQRGTYMWSDVLALLDEVKRHQATAPVRQIPDPDRQASSEFAAVPIVAGAAIAGAAAWWGNHEPQHTAQALVIGFLGLALVAFARLFTRGTRS